MTRPVEYLEPSNNNANINQVHSKKGIPPLTEAESKSLSELTNSLFESMTGFQGFIVQRYSVLENDVYQNVEFQ